jgi:transcriptional regulator with XRE-family HTH domain
VKDIGRRLKSKREELGLTVDQVQAETKIRRRYLEALEAGKEGSLPGDVYVKGFLRFYANFLGLDGQAMVAEYRQWKESLADKEESEPSARPGRREAGPKPLAPAPKAVTPSHGRRSGRLGTLAALVAVILVLVAAAGFWYIWSHVPSGSGGGRDGSPVAGGDAGASDGTATTGGGNGGTVPGEGIGGTTPGSGTGGSDGSSTATRWVVDSESAALARYVVYGAPFTVRFQVVSETCWMRVEVDGRTAFEGTVGAGAGKEFVAKTALTALLGRPHLVSLSLDGQAVGVAGLKDNPRTVEFEADDRPGGETGSGGT